MNTPLLDGDRKLLQEIRQRGAATIAELQAEAGVTRTAVRQRLERLMQLQFVERQPKPQQRGRPSFAYAITTRATRLLDSNYRDLATVLWTEVRNVEDPAIRRELSQQVCDGLVQEYSPNVTGTLDQRLESLAQLLRERRIDVEIDRSGELPVIREHTCPYPELAECDRGICAIERRMFVQLLGCKVKLTKYRLTGHHCCEFEVHE